MERSTLRTSVYHSVLRIALCVVAVMLVFDSGIVNRQTVEMSRNAQMYLAAAVGINASVPANETNVLTARITELEQELKRKDREISLNLAADMANGSTGSNASTFVLSLILFILLILIILNYILDYLRFRRRSDWETGPA